MTDQINKKSLELWSASWVWWPFLDWHGYLQLSLSMLPPLPFSSSLPYSTHYKVSSSSSSSVCLEEKVESFGSGCSAVEGRYQALFHQPNQMSNDNDKLPTKGHHNKVLSVLVWDLTLLQALVTLPICPPPVMLSSQVHSMIVKFLRRCQQ